jgi:hypothetical protein
MKVPERGDAGAFHDKDLAGVGRSAAEAGDMHIAEA